MHALANQMRYALRQLGRHPGYAITVLLTLALSIGANTAIFSVVNALLLRPLPYPQPDRLGTLEMVSGKGGAEEASIDGTTFDQIRDRVPAVMAAVSSGGITSGVNLQTRSGAQYVIARRISAHYLDVLGIAPVLGRNFTENEDRPGGPSAVILSHALWHTLFHDDPHALGQPLLIKSEPFTIVGVLPAQVTLPGGAQIWTPIRPSQQGEGGGDNYGLTVRLRPGANWEQANAQLAPIRSLTLDYIERSHLGAALHYRMVPLQTGQTLEERTPALILLLATGVILLIACANLAGLTLVRVSQRASEFATRLALGASRWIVVKQLWLEYLVLALIGAAAALATAALMLSGLNALLPPEMLPAGGMHFDVRVLGFTLLIALGTSLLFGMMPALATRRLDLRSVINASSHSVSRGSRVRPWLIGGEVALTVVLLAAAGLLVRSLAYLQNLPPGFNAHNMMTAKASLDDVRYHNAAAFHTLMTASVAAMERIPGVQSAAVGLSLPYERGLNYGATVKDGKVAGQRSSTNLVYVTPGYFSTLGMHMISGVGFTEANGATAEPVAIINQSFARKVLGGGDPIGRHIAVDGEKVTARIIGEVGDVVKSPGLDAAAPLASERTVYIPAAQTSSGLFSIAHVWFEPSWIVRTSGPISGLTASMQRALASVDPNLPFSGFYSMEALQAEALTMQRVQVSLLSALAILALLLSGVGIYGLVSHAVVERRREMGIRLALGSTRQQAISTIGRSGLLAAIAGLAAGLLLSIPALRVLRTALYGVGVYDPVALAATCGILLAVALVATAIPAFRIAKVNPAETLRVE